MHATQLGTSLAGVELIHSIAIVGAGFSGTALAIHLACASVRADGLALGLEIPANERPVGRDGGGR